MSSTLAQEILKTPDALTVTTAVVGGVESDEVVPNAQATVATSATEGEYATTDGNPTILVPPTKADATADTTYDIDAPGPSSIPTTASSGTDIDDKDGVTVIITPPKTTEELIAARAVKRIARKTALREAAQEFIARGDAYMEIKSAKAASHQFLEAIKLCRTDPEYFIKLAGSYRKLKWYEEAAHAATRALTLDPKNSEARYVRGVARLEQRLLKPAKIDFETVLAHDPSHLLARAALTEVTHFVSTSTYLGTHTLGPVEGNVNDVDFSFPGYDFDTEGVMDDGELSDSSDCAHVGNGVPCRFYNHEGCTKGAAECQFSHAPDERSVRDDLGKNVCVYHILSSCKFGTLKCIYSHDKSALPKRGWWSSPEQIERVKGIMEVAEKKAKEQREKEAERWKAKMKRRNVGKEQAKAAGADAVADVAAKEQGADGEGAQEVVVVVVGESGIEKPPQTPKSAGVRPRGKSKKQQQQQQQQPKTNGAEEPPKSDVVGDQQEKAEKKKPRARTWRSKKKAAAPTTTALDGSSAGPAQNDSAGFTEYKPNGLPPDNVAMPLLPSRIEHIF